MKKHFYAVLLLLCLSITAFSCGGKHNSPATPDVTTDTTTMSNDSLNVSETTNENGPTVKAASVDNMKMVLDNNGNVVGRYVSTNENI